jgi:wyosine [tRNA(Phe)-imidazoG37] synthetase (radical SAM superfamily)
MTIRYQIQEMLRIEKIFEEEGIQQEIDAYAPLVPEGSNWKATMLIEYPDVNERKRELARLIGVEDRMFIEVEGHARVYAIADEDLDRENDEKTSAVHFVRFEFDPATKAAIMAGAAVKLGCDHTNYPAHTQIADQALASLAGDLK